MLWFSCHIKNIYWFLQSRFSGNPKYRRNKQITHLPEWAWEYSSPTSSFCLRVLFFFLFWLVIISYSYITVLVMGYKFIDHRRFFFLINFDNFTGFSNGKLPLLSSWTHGAPEPTTGHVKPGPLSSQLNDSPDLNFLPSAPLLRRPPAHLSTWQSSFLHFPSLSCSVLFHHRERAWGQERAAWGEANTWPLSHSEGRSDPVCHL